MTLGRGNVLILLAGLVVVFVVVQYRDRSEQTLGQLPGTMTEIARVPSSIEVWHLKYKDRHYLVTSKGGIMILPRWIEGSAKVAPPLERLGTRHRGPEPTIEDLTRPGTVITGEVK